MILNHQKKKELKIVQYENRETLIHFCKIHIIRLQKKLKIIYIEILTSKLIFFVKIGIFIL